MTTGKADREHASKGSGSKNHGARRETDVKPPEGRTRDVGEEGDAPRVEHAAHERRGRHSRKDVERRVEELSSEADRLKVEIEESKDKYLRVLADFDNYRKRVARENEERTRCANEDLIARLLEVVDNMERAFEAARGAEDFEGLRKGLELTFVRLKEILTREGLCPIECVGEKFDPNYHEAVMAVEKEGAEGENVIEEIQKGYMLKGKVIRPSKVVVSK